MTSAPQNSCIPYIPFPRPCCWLPNATWCAFFVGFFSVSCAKQQSRVTVWCFFVACTTTAVTCHSKMQPLTAWLSFSCTTTSVTCRSMVMPPCYDMDSNQQGPPMLAALSPHNLQSTNLSTGLTQPGCDCARPLNKVQTPQHVVEHAACCPSSPSNPPDTQYSAARPAVRSAHQQQYHTQYI